MPIPLELKAGDHWWCSCGLSGNQPMCDGSHKGTGKGPLKFNLAEDKKVWLCDCKRSGNPPYCDGTHSKPALEQNA
ncbi:MAG: CDGSH iron-sulfur domain-containing protein [Verrucomicrobiaceae bacterium]|nr:CDGSH iron-sulfur domain-containing protein [Verrucomicrobiaceae bacterium]